MFRKHSWGNVSISQGDRTKAQQTDKTFLRTDFSDFFFFIPFAQFPVSDLDVLSCAWVVVQKVSKVSSLLRSPVTWHAEFHNSTQREKAARWPFHLFHLALSWYPPLRYSPVIYVVATGKTDITCSWQCATSKLIELLRWRLQNFHLHISTLLFPPYDMKAPIENNKNKLWPWHFKHRLSSFCHSSHCLKAAYTENFWNHHLKQNIII